VGGGNQCLFNRRAHAPAHFPEVGLEPGRFLKDRDQLGLARGRGIEIGEAVQVGRVFAATSWYGPPAYSSIQTL
jgi:hypothetical protein